MQKIAIGLIVSMLSFSSWSQVEGDKGPSSHWYKVLPEEKSLISQGNAKERELNPELIRALVWNIKKTIMPNWKKEFTEYGKDRDLFLVQEAYETSLFSDTLDSFSGSQWEFGISFLYKKYGDAATGTMVGSFAAPTEVLVKHSPDLEPVVATPKSVTFAKYPLRGKNGELLVVSIHAINFETTGAFKRHIDQIGAEVSKHVGPVLLAGDFNTWNDSRTAYLESVVAKLKLKEADYINGDQRMQFRGNYLDHVYSRNLNIIKVEVKGESSGSDHKPLLVELSVP